MNATISPSSKREQKSSELENTASSNSSKSIGILYSDPREIVQKLISEGYSPERAAQEATKISNQRMYKETGFGKRSRRKCFKL